MQQHLSDFFRAQSGNGFRANGQIPLRVEFNRLAAKRWWTGDEYRQNWCRCVVSEIRRLLDLQPGDGKREQLRKLCRALEVLDMTEDDAGVKQCEEALQGVYINILDWLDAERSGRLVYFFPSYTKLSHYTHRHKKYLPQQVMRELPVLRPLVKNLGGGGRMP